MKRIDVALSEDRKKLLLYFKFDYSLVELIKTSLSDRRFQKKPTAHWEVPYSSLDKVKKLASETVDVFFTKDLVDYVKAKAEEQALILKEKKQYLDYLIEAGEFDKELPSGWRLRDYQADTAKLAIETIQTTPLKGFIYALDMGLGKTITSLITARAYQRVFGCDIVAIVPAFLKGGWKATAELNEIENIHYFSWAKIPAKWKNDFILIADEAHYAKTGTGTKRGKALLKLVDSKNCLGSLLLSGTPMPNAKPRELYPLLKAIGHPLADNKRDYEIEYCNGRYVKYFARGDSQERKRWDIEGAKNLDKLYHELRYGMQRLKKDECESIPPKSRVFREVEVSPSDKAEYEVAYKQAQTEYKYLKSSPEFSDSAALVLLTRLRQAASNAKIASTVELAEELLAQDRPVVVFVQFLETAHALHEKLGGELCIGGIPPEKRYASEQRFQNGDSNVFIATFGAGGVGLNLMRSTDVIMADRPWTPGEVQQCEDRVYRIGQTKKSFAYWLQFGEADDRVDNALQVKQERISLVEEGKRKTMRGTKITGKWLCKELFD